VPGQTNRQLTCFNFEKEMTDILDILFNPFVVRRLVLYVILGFVALIFLGFLYVEIKRNWYDPDK
jgi:hypothetical protein